MPRPLLRSTTPSSSTSFLPRTHPQLPQSSVPSSMSPHWTKKRSRGPYLNPPTPQPLAPTRSPMGSGRRSTASTQTFSYHSSTPSSYMASIHFPSRRPTASSSRNQGNPITPLHPLSA